MKRSREGEDDADGVKRARLTAPLYAMPWLFGVMPLELFVDEILPATGHPRLVRALLALTCHAGAASARSMVLARAYNAERQLLVDQAILAGADWLGVARWALERPSEPFQALRISFLTTIDALVIAGDAVLMEHFCNRYGRRLNAAHAERCAAIARLPKKTRKARRAYDSPLDLAAYHGRLDAIRVLLYYGYPSLFESATLRPCIDSGNIHAFEWMATTTGIGVFFGHEEDDAEPSGDAYFEFCWRIGKRGNLGFMREFQQVMLKHGFEAGFSCAQAAMRGAACGGHLEMLDALIQEGYVCGRVVEAATLGSQLAVLNYSVGKLRVDANFDGGLHHRWWDSDDIRLEALARGDASILAYIDANVGLLVDMGFTREDLQATIHRKYWTGMQWLVEQKHMSPRGLQLNWDHGDCDPIILSWLAKRGVRFPLARISSLLKFAAEQPQRDPAQRHPYSYERWLADTLFDRHRDQITIIPDRDYLYPDGFYGDLAHLHPRQGWLWGFERGIKFPSTLYPWMRSDSVHPQCRAILAAIFAPTRPATSS